MDNTELIDMLTVRPGDVSRIETDAQGKWIVLESGDRVLIGGALYDKLVDISAMRLGLMCYRISPIEIPGVGERPKQIDIDKFSRQDIVLRVTGFVGK